MNYRLRVLGTRVSLTILVGVGMAGGKAWSTAEVQILREVYPISGAKEVARLTARPYASVLKKAQYLGVSATRGGSRSASTKNSIWTPQEIDLLKREYGTTPLNELSAKLGRAVTSIYARAHKLNLQRQSSWRAEEIALLHQFASEKTISELAKILNRHLASVYSKLKALNLQAAVKKTTLSKPVRHPKSWTDQEIDSLRTFAKYKNARESAAALGRSLKATYKMSAQLGITFFNHTTGGAINKWTTEEIAMLREIYPTAQYNAVRELGVKIGRTPTQIFSMARRLGIKRGTPTQMRGGMWRPVGSEITSEGVTYRKISETGNPKADWKRVCEIEWEARFGPIPTGMTIMPIKRNLPRHPNNMKLVRMEDIPILAAQMNSPPEIVKLFRLKAQLGLQLSRMEKKQSQMSTQ